MQTQLFFKCCETVDFRLYGCILCIFEASAKLVEFIETMLDPKIQSKIGAVYVRPVSTAYKTMTRDILL